MNNDLSDITGLRVGQVHDEALRSGVTVVVSDRMMTASVDVRGGAPGTRETDLLSDAMTVEAIDAVAISGGSAFGLDSASGVQAALREQGRGFAVGGVTIPIVPGVILFDLLNGGDKDWGRYPPYRDMAYEAAMNAGGPVALGSHGAGFGATTVDQRGGTGSASATTASGFTVAALAAVNAAGSATVGDGPHFWAAPYEQDGEFGGLGFPQTLPPDALEPHNKTGAMTATTPAIVATNAQLTKAQAHRVAMMAQDGMARALHPIHTPVDGDTVFAIASGEKPVSDPVAGLIEIGTAAAHCLARAIARGVYEADSSVGFPGLPPNWRDRFPQA